MDFVDSLEQAEFRAEARAWLAQHAPRGLHEVLKSASYGDAILASPELIAASKAWQRKKQAAGWACIITAHAQSSVSLYGLIDTGRLFTNNQTGHSNWQEVSNVDRCYPTGREHAW